MTKNKTRVIIRALRFYAEKMLARIGSVNANEAAWIRGDVRETEDVLRELECEERRAIR